MAGSLQVGCPICASRRVAARAAASTAQAPSAKKQKDTIKEAKAQLKLQIAGTQRGSCSSSVQRGQVAEAQAALESLSQGIALEDLQGLWRLIYTTAPDVGPLIGIGGSAPLTSLLTPLTTGSIYQRFSSPAAGTIENIIEFSLPPLLRPGQGITACVRADWTVRSPRRIQLRFREAGVSQLHISDETEALLAPALLPRTWLTQRLLMALQEFQFKLSLRTPSSTESIQQNFGSDYLFTYLDADMLCGLQTASGGLFIFERAPDSEVPVLP